MYKQISKESSHSSEEDIRGRTNHPLLHSISNLLTPRLCSIPIPRGRERRALQSRREQFLNVRLQQFRVKARAWRGRRRGAHAVARHCRM